ncbi:calcium-translocating P-type ATPase, SERCA-type [archaeon]|nr:calcium-translocating P-type ATPase, SERCA-type [archaeon]|tara:strand:+ start:34458 stop:37082 length:2625 start_codon:yes stop_codon:yes gene_type:complete
MDFYKKDVDNVFRELKTSKDGLSEEESKLRLQKYGLNELKEGKRISPFKIFINQFKSFVVYILIGALVISLFFKEFIDSIVIGAILLLNGVLGFIQEYKAEKSIQALKKLSSLHIEVVRESKIKRIDSKDLVPGDVIVLETGKKIPCDARIIENNSLQTQEASLTGESIPISKNVKSIKENCEIADQDNMIFSGTTVVNGRGRAVVTGTGMKTEIGKIATLIEGTEQTLTPLQIKLNRLGKTLGYIVIVVALIVFVGGTLKGGSFLEMLLVGVSLAVAAVPEGLPAVVTISLAVGVKKMVKKNALIRKLPSVETLGSITVIGSDKTGTLTKNEMAVQRIYVNGKVIDVTGSGYDKEGKFLYKDQEVNDKELEFLLEIGVLCNNALFQDDHELIGDPTEGSLLVSAGKFGIDKKNLEKKRKRLKEEFFTSERKMMSTLHKWQNKNMIMSKGAPEKILSVCDRIYENGKVRKLSEKDKNKILKVNENLALNALRVLGFAYKESDKLEENKLIFVGLQGMIDPEREEAKVAIRKCKEAGIRVIMITGDHAVTAKAIGSRLGIKGKVLTGQEIDKLEHLKDVINKYNIYARVNPEHKIKIVDALQNNGEIVAMTGDGVNDAPALKKADIGVSMGVSGTDVAKESSDMILLDDNFATIVSAIEEGRSIYDNVKKFVNYLLSSNMGEVLILFIALIIGFTFGGNIAIPLIAIHLLWVNLITDGFPALALGLDSADEGVMKKAPRKPKERIVSRNMWYNILLIGILMTGLSLFLFNKYLQIDLVKAQTMVFTTLVVLEMVRIYMVESIYKKNVFTNKFLLLAVGFSLLLQVIVLYTGLGKYLKVIPLELVDWGLILIGVVIVFALSRIGYHIIKNVTQEFD